MTHAVDLRAWAADTHPLGRGRLVARYVSIHEDGAATLRVRRSGFRGAQLRSRDRYRRGAFEATIRSAVPAGALCAFFLYQTGVGEAADEIDIEVIGGTRRLMLTTWVKGRRTNHAEVTLPFDPAEAPHRYGIARSARTVAFTMDGREVARFTQDLPTAAMPLMLNAWWPAWLEPGSAAGVMEVERVSAGAG